MEPLNTDIKKKTLFHQSITFNIFKMSSLATLFFVIYEFKIFIFGIINVCKFLRAIVLNTLFGCSTVCVSRIWTKFKTFAKCLHFFEATNNFAKQIAKHNHVKNV